MKHDNIWSHVLLRHFVSWSQFLSFSMIFSVPLFFFSFGEQSVDSWKILWPAVINSTAKNQDALSIWNFWGARVAKWWEHSPPTNVAQVQISASKPYLGCVRSWFSPLLPTNLAWLFSGYSGFPLSSKTNICKFQFDLECTDIIKGVHKNS